MALVPEIALFLQVAGLGTVGTNLFRHELPESPVNAIAVLKPPVDDGSIHTFGAAGSAPAADQVRFDVVVRNTDRATAYLNARKVRNALSEQSGALTNPDFGSGDGSTATTRYLLIRALSDPAERPTEKAAGYEFAVRFSAMKERS